jgi:hypothetical protein
MRIKVTQLLNQRKILKASNKRYNEAMYINLIIIDCTLLFRLRFATLTKINKAILLFKTSNVSYVRIE